MSNLYDAFLKRLDEVREWEWNNYDIKIHEEFEMSSGYKQLGVRSGETALQAIARHMVEVVNAEMSK